MSRSFECSTVKRATCGQRNRFEQVCINLTNERLQRFFYDELIPKQIAHYRSEGVDVKDIVYDDNAACVNLLMEVGCRAMALRYDRTVAFLGKAQRFTYLGRRNTDGIELAKVQKQSTARRPAVARTHQRADSERQSTAARQELFAVG